MLLQVTKSKTIPLKGLSLYLSKIWLDVLKKILDSLFRGIIGINKNIFSSFTQKRYDRSSNDATSVALFRNFFGQLRFCQSSDNLQYGK